MSNDFINYQNMASKPLTAKSKKPGPFHRVTRGARPGHWEDLPGGNSKVYTLLDSRPAL